MNWIPPYVGANPQIAYESPAQAKLPNPYLQPIAQAEHDAENKTGFALALAQTAAGTHAQYDAAYVAIDAALAAWNQVRALADKIAKADDFQGTDEHTAWMHEAKLAIPGIATALAQARAQLTALHGSLSSDQALHRPDLGPAPAPETTGGPPLLLVVAGGAALLYALVRWVL